MDIYFPDLPYLDLMAIVEDILTQSKPSKAINVPASSNVQTDSLEIPISRVIYSGLATTVYFTDGTKTTVSCSANDHYDRQTAIVYALIKKIFGKVGRYDKNGKYHAKEIDGNGIGLKLEKIAAAGYDQDAEEKLAKEKKEVAKANHIAKQEAEHKAAWERKVQARAEEIRLEREANAFLDREASLKKNGNKTPLNESKMTTDELFSNSATVVRAKDLPKGTTLHSGLVQIDPKDAWKLYRRPDKPFSQFTNEEKREYWRYQNAKRRAEGKR